MQKFALPYFKEIMSRTREQAKSPSELKRLRKKELMHNFMAFDRRMFRDFPSMKKTFAR